LHSREIATLGRDPGKFIRYPGGNAYYFDEQLVETLEGLGVINAAERLDDLLWNFIRPSIKNKLAYFRKTENSKRSAAVKCAPAPYHLFDQRRVLFLKSGQLDQGPIGHLPDKIFRILDHKSRDELEQYFLYAERVLRPDEYKLYTYVVFDLQHGFTSPLARKFPAALDGVKMDSLFIEAVCRLETDPDLWRGFTGGQGFNAYLARYVAMYFDNAFPQENFMDAYVRDFMRRHRRFRFPDAKIPAMDLKAAGSALGLLPEQLKSMSHGELTRHYRKLAIKLHPDQGGDPADFIRITEAYQTVLSRLKKK